MMTEDTCIRTIRIGGMSCVNCQNRIEKQLKSTAGIEEASVSYNTGTATVRYKKPVIGFHEITHIIEKLDYRVLEDQGAGEASPGSGRRASGMSMAGTLIIILALYMILRRLGISNITSAFPLAEAGMGYGMLFIIGLVTSVHCAAMCGGINLSQTLQKQAQRTEVSKVRRRFAVLVPSALYNGGRIVSYTLVGIFAGALGSVISVSGRFQGAVQLLAGIFMVIMGINMLGFFPALRRFNLRMPKFFAGKIDKEKEAGRNPLFIGLLNGLMPCGPLQAMQLYALSTGSPVAGGVSMFLFSAGTVPLMFGLGALSSLLSGSFGHGFSAKVMKIGAVLVSVLGLTMFTNGWSLSALPDPLDALAAFLRPSGSQAASGNAFTPLIENGVQIINSSLSGGRYPAITVQEGIPVKWTINAPQGSINGCNNRMIIREYGIEHSFTPGENVIEFIPKKAGRFAYSCWMGMIRSSITVVGKGRSAVLETESDTGPKPAGVDIAAGTIAIAEMNGEGWQTVRIDLRDEGFDPAIIVVQKFVPVAWTVNNDSLDEGNSGLIVPAYYARVDIDQGDNVIQFMPAADFDFSTRDNVFYGYVKALDDIASVDIEAIKAEAAEFETLIYPDAWFEQAGAGASCH
ncbi:MAG: sulfite exporter TauE/SafE family protein [Treponema sp.]|jgi:sulfite exporter TauE/SafE/copper chaperone CopZ/plastocyanin domain-containing protein|nr:sulfite exporter TauE/SafE family protein [Treponema sp.]